MTKITKHKLGLDRPATYQIKVPGHLDQSWADWAGGMTITVEGEDDGPPVTTLTGKLDQAALQSLLRRHYPLGLPLISVITVGWPAREMNCKKTEQSDIREFHNTNKL